MLIHTEQARQVRKVRKGSEVENRYIVYFQKINHMIHIISFTIYNVILCYVNKNNIPEAQDPYASRASVILTLTVLLTWR